MPRRVWPGLSPEQTSIQRMEAVLRDSSFEAVAGLPTRQSWFATREAGSPLSAITSRPFYWQTGDCRAGSLSSLKLRGTRSGCVDSRTIHCGGESE